MSPLRFLLGPLVLALVFIVGGGCGGDAPERASSGLTPEELEREVRRADSLNRDVPYVPTSMPVVDRMLELAEVTADDVVYDLGSGDGRIPIRAAQQYGARGVGIEIDEALVQEARQKADSAGVADRVTFRHEDLFNADISDATVVTLYLLPTINLRVRAKLFEELAPGTRVVSHDFAMGDWAHEERVEVDGATLYRWTIPEELPERLQQ
ncbi:MAG: methyltransferase domain-containing protein [Bacteroidetes bacterium]|nr:methyltransferase domain-containing protein [Bacteroidota bacterium]